MQSVDELERITGQRFELVGGHIYAMSGGTIEHATVAGELMIQLGPQLKVHRRCRICTSDLRVAVGEGEFRYPDASVVCGPVNPEALTTDQPTALFEVTSKTTRAADYGKKREEYTALTSLMAYIIVDLQEGKVVSMHRTETGWMEQIHAQGTFEVHGISATLDVDELLGSVET